MTEGSTGDATATGVTTWVTSPGDDSVRLAIAPPAATPATATTTISPTTTFQTWRGVGAAMTDSSVALLGPGELTRLFDPTAVDGARLNLVRLPLSATDFSSRAWTWEWDRRRGLATPTPEADAAIDAVAAAAALRTDLEVMAAAWTAPAWMKTSRSEVGGALRRRRARTYADMLAAQAEVLVARGTPLTTMTVGNEPGHSGDYPTMTMSDRTMGRIADRLGPRLDALGVELHALDHNWDDRARADSLLGRSDAFDAVAFHCYGGSPDQMAGLDVPVMVTECTGTTDAWYSTFGWDARELVVRSAEAGSTGLLMWNLALDPQHGPKADWGCRDCRGLLTVDPHAGTAEPTPEFYTLAHVARAADPGAVRVASTPVDAVPLVAFANPDGTMGVFAQNDTGNAQTLRIDVAGGASHGVELAPGEMMTMRIG